MHQDDHFVTQPLQQCSESTTGYGHNTSSKQNFDFKKNRRYTRKVFDEHLQEITMNLRQRCTDARRNLPNARSPWPPRLQVVRRVAWGQGRWVLENSSDFVTVRCGLARRDHNVELFIFINVVNFNLSTETLHFGPVSNTSTACIIYYPTPSLE